jgi:hypothetical protein
MSSYLDAFMPESDIRKRHSIQVRAPAHVVFDVARDFDLQSVPLVRTLFRLRAQTLGGRDVREPGPVNVASLLRMGWSTLDERSGRVFIAGAACRPWQADVVFTPIPADRFRTYAEPEQVKIAWTLEVEPLGFDRSRLETETRAVGTDPAARRRFRRYWRIFGMGIVAIRWLMLPAMRREAERRWRATGSRSV